MIFVTKTVNFLLIALTGLSSFFFSFAILLGSAEFPLTLLIVNVFRFVGKPLVFIDSFFNGGLFFSNLFNGLINNNIFFFIIPTILIGSFFV